ncbi:MAG: Crp/Fnr family transcriptional regulator [Cytophagaceae bacterium]|nr:Crp/Fnr family transcriptional regulator [Cytophagaceae bacterium]
MNLLKDDVKRIYFLKKGLLTISRHEGKKEITVDVINQGDVFGQIYSDQNFNSNKESIKVISDEAVICTFTKENFEKVLQNNPSLCLKYSKKVGDRLLSIQQRYSNLVFKDAKTRLIEFLIEYSRRNGNQNENNFVAKNMLTHQDIADLIGCQRQTISTLLKELKEENSIDYSRDQIVVSNIAHLK